MAAGKSEYEINPATLVDEISADVAGVYMVAGTPAQLTPAQARTLTKIGLERHGAPLVRKTQGPDASNEE